MASVVAIGGLAMAAYEAAPSKLVAGLWIAATGLTAAIRVLAVRITAKEETSGAGDSDHARVAECVAGLTFKHNLPQPKIAVVDEEARKMGVAGMFDRLMNRDAVRIAREACQKLSNPQLEFVMAHELNHANRWWTKFSSAEAWMKMVAYPGIFLAGAHAFYTLGGPGGFGQGSLLALYAGLWGLGRLILLSGIPGAFASRLNEHKADIRAVAMTGNPDAAVRALECVEKLAAEKEPSKETSTPGLVDRLLRSHPQHEERTKLIRDVFTDRRAARSRTPAGSAVVDV